MRRSRLSAWRTSPTMIRDGRMRSASLTRRRSGMSPVPSSDGCRHCIDATSRCGIRSSKTSSHVTMRSRGGTADARQLSSVVLPAWVPPATRMLRPDATAASRNRAAWRVSVPSRTRSSIESALTTNLRTLTYQWSRVMSGMTTCNRLPSVRTASTKGEERSTRRPDDLSMRSTRSRTWSWLSNVVVSSATPLRATKTRLGSLIQNCPRVIEYRWRALASASDVHKCRHVALATTGCLRTSCGLPADWTGLHETPEWAFGSEWCGARTGRKAGG